MKMVMWLFMMAGVLAGCQSVGQMTPAEDAAIVCMIAEDGTAIATNVAKGGAAVTAAKLQGAVPAVCDASAVVGKALSK